MSAALLSAAMLSNVYAAGLGKLTVLSSLGQPLRAEIELTSVEPDELGTLVPRLAPADAYREANIDLNPVLLSLRFATEQRNGTPIIRVTSTQPINEPFVDMLLELGGGKGKLVREYTFLLDPPEMRSARASSVTPVAIGRASSAPAQSSASPATSAPASPAPAAAAPSSVRSNTAPSRPTQSAAPAKAAASPDYEVKKGDTLAKIANQYREPGVSLDQMLVALYRANPEAFIGKNMNRLRAGQILSIPAATTAEVIEQSEARGVVVAQASDFNRYRSKLAAQVAAANAQPSEEGGQTAGGKITTRIQEESGSTNAQDKLKLSKSGTTVGSTGSAGVTEEELIARDKALAEANARVKELEKNVSELQKILEIKNKDLATQQKQAETTTAPATAASTGTATAEAEKPATDAANTAANTAAETSEPAAAAPPADAAAAPAAEQAKPAPKAKPKRMPPPPAPVQQPSFFDDLAANPMFLPGAAVLLALLAGLGIYSSRRRKQPSKSFEDSIITDSSLKSNSLFGSTGGQSVDTNNSVFNSNFVPSASQLDTNEVDPIAEADVYIAYGRDAQAEEILKEALRTQPDRHAVRVKLLEIYSNRNDVRSFEILATELYSMTKGEGEDWQQAAALGMALDPGNPLYASGNALPADVAAKASSLTASTQPLDEQGLDELLDMTQPDPNTTLESSPYFNNTTLLTGETQPMPPREEPAAPAAAEQKQPVEDLDFDLEGFDIGQPEKKDEDQAAPKAELPADVASIDFGFLDSDKPATSASESLASETPASAAPEASLPESFDLEFPASSEPAQPTAKPEEFDLSDITLELEPSSPTAVGQPASEALPPLEGLDDESFSSNTEMATKLDLAIAYQEIGDKEGARELLEEVVKGGNSEQSARAGELLAKLS
ncbi:MAG TPA: FimV/HubP family polar landmark protein [Oxalicibacterium sp.]